MFQHKAQAKASSHTFKQAVYGDAPAQSTASAALPYSDVPLQRHTPFAEATLLPLPEGMALISKADVFTPDGSTLLLTAGQNVDSTLLGRLICFGIEPKHFTLASQGGRRLSESETQLLSKTLSAYWQRFDTVIEGQHRAYKKPEPNTSDHPFRVTTRGQTKKKTDVVILDSNPESASKTTYALKRTGVALHHIHTVTDVAMLKLSIDSFEPHTVIVDFFQGKGEAHGAQVLCQLRELFPDLNLALTLNWRSKLLHPALVYWLKRLAHIKAEVVYKPLQPKALSTIMKQYKPCIETSLTSHSHLTLRAEGKF
jgi:hypothetical protein